MADADAGGCARASAATGHEAQPGLFDRQLLSLQPASPGTAGAPSLQGERAYPDSRPANFHSRKH